MAGRAPRLRGPSCESIAPLAGGSPAAVRLREQIQRVARTRTTVLLTGECGLEFETLARAIHGLSELAEGPFRSIDGRQLAAAVPRSAAEGALARLLEGETGAGSLHLGEVSVLGQSLQRELARFLEERAAGPQESVPRLIASSAQDLEMLVSEGRFDEHLLYRLNVLRVVVPSLRERRGDLPELLGGALGRAQRALGSPLRFAPAALEALTTYTWPGNLFELETVVGLAALRAEEGSVRLEHLPALEGARVPDGLRHRGAPLTAGQGLLEPIPGERSLRALEEATIRRVLHEEDGNRSRTARILGINRTTLYNKLRQFGIS